MLAVVIQIDGYDPVANAAVTLRASSRDHPAVCHLDGQTWWPTIAKLPTLRYDLFDGAFGGEITAPSSTTTLAVEPWPDFGRYSLADARFRLWTGVVGADWSTYTLRFDGRVSEQPETKDGQAQVAFGVDDRWLDQALLPTYAGTTGIEGPASLKGQVKPLCLGAPRYVPGVLIDVVNSVFQVSFAAVKAITAAMDRLVRFGAPAANYATYADLVAATIPPGRWATCLASGLARFGAPPEGLISFLVEGDNGGPNGWARLPGQLIRRLALLSGAGDRLAGATLDALDAARPYQLSLYLDGQTTARQLIQQLAASVNAVAAVSWTGKLVVLPVQLSAPTITLAVDGSALPPVASVGQVAISAPWSKLAIGAERAWAVHDLADIAFTAPLLELGPYNAATIYREGNIVSRDDGSRWLYVAAAASAGNAPPDLPTTSNTWWRLLSRGGSVDLTDVKQRLTTVENQTASAASNASAALSQLTAITADNVLDRSEKGLFRQLYGAIVDEQAGLVAQAQARGVDPSPLQSAQAALASYLGSLSPAWDNPNVDTPLPMPGGGDTLRGYFRSYYQAKINLLAAIDGKARDRENVAVDLATKAASDGWLDGSEKRNAIIQRDAILAQMSALVSKSDNLGRPADAENARTAAGNAVYNGLVPYLNNLNPPLTDRDNPTAINAAAYINAWSNATTAVDGFEAALLGTVSLDVKAAVTKINDVTNDGVWDAGEKSTILIPEDRRLEAAYQLLRGKAAPLAGVSALISNVLSTADNARTNWISFRSGRTPAWDDTSGSTQINRQQARDVLVVYGQSLDSLAEALRAYTETVAIDARARTAAIDSDGVLSRGEKSRYVDDWQVLNAELNALNQQNQALGYPSAIQSASNTANSKVTSLGNYLGGLSPAWDNALADTTVNPTSIQTFWVEARSAVGVYTAALAGRTTTSGGSTPSPTPTPTPTLPTVRFDNTQIYHDWGSTKIVVTMTAGQTVDFTFSLEAANQSDQFTSATMYVQVGLNNDSFTGNLNNGTSLDVGGYGQNNRSVAASFTNNTGGTYDFMFRAYTTVSGGGSLVTTGNQNSFLRRTQ